MKDYRFSRQLYIIPDRERIDESIALSVEIGANFEYNDFIYPDVLCSKKKIDEIISFYSRLGRDMSSDTAHGAFYDITVHSSDKDIERISKERILTSMDIASQMGLRGVVFHTNFTPNFIDDSYMRHWVDANIEFFGEVLIQYPKTEIYIENMFDMNPDGIRALAEAFSRLDKDSRIRLGICLDYAHINAFSDNDEAWVRDLAPFIRHIHLNDNDTFRDTHDTIGRGLIDWKLFDERMNRYEVGASVLIEIQDIAKQKESYDFLKQNHIYPF